MAITPYDYSLKELGGRKAMHIQRDGKVRTCTVESLVGEHCWMAPVLNDVLRPMLTRLMVVLEGHQFQPDDKLVLSLVQVVDDASGTKEVMGGCTCARC